jgi:hypothetical protein
MQTTHYEITVRGRLSARLLAAFDGLTATSSSTQTVLRGELVDQAALYGVLERIESLGLELLGVRRGASKPQAAGSAGCARTVSTTQGGPQCHPC